GHAFELACVVFFFQAEDGIRDFHVTGVQTCALPISARPELPRPEPYPPGPRPSPRPEPYPPEPYPPPQPPRPPRMAAVDDSRRQIGRASCRERAEPPGGVHARSTEAEASNRGERAAH